MSKILIFNPATLEQREVPDRDAERAVNELGWVRVGGANVLVAIHHPGMNDHKMVLQRDLPTWENKGYYVEPTWIYHPEEGPRMVSASQAREIVGKNGWCESPADFTKAEKVALKDAVAKAVKEAKA